MTFVPSQETLDVNAYQVFLCASPAHFPFWFATHPWLVINQKGKISRFGVSFTKYADPNEPFGIQQNQGHWGHLYRNYFPPWQGIRMFPMNHGPLWRGRVIGMIEGVEGSLAERMADFIARSGETYPYRDQYRLLGRNSNTYVAWVLAQFPESGLKLPWNAIGKGY